MKPWHTKLLASFVILGVLGTGIGLYFYFTPIFIVEFPEKRNFYWFSVWNNASYERLVESYEEIDMISPSWWNVFPNGSINDDNWELDVSPEEVLDFCRNNSIEIHPLVSNYAGEFSSELISDIINNETNVINFINSANFFLDYYNCTGINLDFEGIPAEDRDAFNDFLYEVKENLNSKYVLSIDVSAKSADWTTGWGGAFNYSIIGEICDYVMIMTYDYSWGGSEPGQISPINWIKRVLDYAVKTIPHEKIYCGIPLYGYNWPDTGETAISGGYSYFVGLTVLYDVEPKRYSDSKELHFQYTCLSGISYTAVFQDHISTKSKLQR